MIKSAVSTKNLVGIGAAIFRKESLLPAVCIIFSTDYRIIDYQINNQAQIKVYPRKTRLLGSRPGVLYRR